MFNIRILWSTNSNAFCKSIKIATTFLSKKFVLAPTLALFKTSDVYFLCKVTLVTITDDKFKNALLFQVLQKIAERIANIELDEENGIKITEVTGTQIRDEFFDCKTQSTKTVFAPSGFVDLRPMITETRRAANYVYVFLLYIF